MVEAIQIIERRAKARVETKVKVKIGGRGATHTFNGNLSKSGVFLETAEPFAQIGEKVQMKITLPTAKDPIAVTARVARIEGPNRVGVVPGMGFEFLRVEARQTRTFDRLLDRLLDARGIGCRRYPRAMVQVVVEFRTKDEVRRTIAEDLSKGGLFLRTAIDGFVLGDTLNIVLQHPTTKRKFSIDAEIVHIRKGESTIRQDFVEGLGVQFLDMSSARRNDMSAFLRGLLSTRKS